MVMQPGWSHQHQSLHQCDSERELSDGCSIEIHQQRLLKMEHIKQRQKIICK